MKTKMFVLFVLVMAIVLIASGCSLLEGPQPEPATTPPPTVAVPPAEVPTDVPPDPEEPTPVPAEPAAEVVDPYFGFQPCESVDALGNTLTREQYGEGVRECSYAQAQVADSAPKVTVYIVKTGADVFNDPSGQLKIGTFTGSDNVRPTEVSEGGKYVQIEDLGWVKTEDVLRSGQPYLFTVATNASVYSAPNGLLELGTYKSTAPINPAAVSEKGDYILIQDVGWIPSAAILLDGKPLTVEQAKSLTTKWGNAIPGAPNAQELAQEIGEQITGKTSEELFKEYNCLPGFCDDLADTSVISGTVTTTEQGPDGAALDTIEQGDWEVSFFEGATQQMRGWFERIKDPNPSIWKVFPNQPNSDLNNEEWRVVTNAQGGKETPDGLEYGLDESVFMEQNEMGNFPVQARGYRYISGDYNIPGIDACEAETAEAGCAIALFNVGEVTADISAWVRQGFTVPGRYWNGDKLEIGMWALASHGSANLLNMTTFGAGNDTLNVSNRTNAGANCSNPEGCEQVRFVIVVMSGNQVLVKAVIIVDPT